MRSIAIIIIITPNNGRKLIGNHRFISILFNPQTLVLNLVQNLASFLSSNAGLVFLTLTNKSDICKIFELFKNIISQMTFKNHSVSKIKSLNLIDQHISLKYFQLISKMIL